MRGWKVTSFSQILLDSKDGEWGKSEQLVGFCEVTIIRGTDFANLDNPSTEFPRRWVRDHIAERKHLQPGDIILETAGGTSTQSTGRTAILKKSFFLHHSDIPVLCASFSRHLRLNTSKYSPRFIYYLLQELHRTGYMAVFNIQHTGVSRFQYTAFKKHTELQIPELRVQRQIAAILSAYDELIENNMRRIALLEKLTEEVYCEWFVRLRFPGHESAKFIKGTPQTWDNTTFGKFCVLKRGYDLPEQNVTPGSYPVVASTTIKTYHDEFKAEPPVITTGRSGSLGTVLMVNCRAWPLNTALYVKDFCGNSPYLIFYTLKNMGLENFNSGAGVPTLNRNHINGIKMAVPDKQLQRQFDTTVKPLHEQKEQLTKATAVLTRARESLLPRLMSGKLSVENRDIHFPPGMAEELEAESTAAAYA
jgi:type I restriction enzyme S subunit